MFRIRIGSKLEPMRIHPNTDPGVYLDADQDANPGSRINGYPGGSGARYHVYALILGQLLLAPDPYPNSLYGSGLSMVIHADPDPNHCRSC